MTGGGKEGEKKRGRNFEAKHLPTDFESYYTKEYSLLPFLSIVFLIVPLDLIITALNCGCFLRVILQS